MMLVVWGHIMEHGSINCFIYSFHIPLFFFISGMMFSRSRQKGFKDFILKRIKTIVLPYVAYSVVTWFVWVLYNVLLHNTVESYLMPLFQTFIAQGSGGFLVHNVPLWFVTCLIVVEVLYYFVDMLPEIFNAVVCAGLSCIGYLMIQVWSDTFKLLPWSIEVAFAAMVFYATGSLLIKHIKLQVLEKKFAEHKFISVAIIVALGIFVFLSSQYLGHVSMGSDSLGNNPLLFYFTAFCGTAMTLIFSILLSTVLYSPLVNGIKWIGENSFRVMAIHNPIKGFVVVAIANILHCGKTIVESSYVYCGISFVITFAITIAVVMIVKKVIRYFD